MKVVGKLESATIDGNVKYFVSGESVIEPDDLVSYANLKDIVKEHHTQMILKKVIGKFLPRVHVAISNAKRPLQDIHHTIILKHLKQYERVLLQVQPAILRGQTLRQTVN